MQKESNKEAILYVRVSRWFFFFEVLRSIAEYLLGPQRREVPNVALGNQDIDSPSKRNHVEGQKLTRLVKLGMLEF